MTEAREKVDLITELRRHGSHRETLPADLPYHVRRMIDYGQELVVAACAALEAANTRAEEAEGMLKDADEHVARLTTEKVQQFARATAAEAENARLREALEKIGQLRYAGYCITGATTREDLVKLVGSFYAEILHRVGIANQALASAPAIAPPPAPAPEASEARDIARRKGVRKDARKFVQNVQNSLGGGTPEARRQYEDRAVDVLTHLLDRALDAHRDGGGR